MTPGCHMPHQSGRNKELGVVQLSIYYLHIYISTHWVQRLACTIFYESLQKYVTSNNDIPISNVRSSDKLIPQLSCVEVCLDRYALMIYDVYDLSSDN